jgi:hypothetical protein
VAHQLSLRTAWAHKRGYHTAKAARLDVYRAANSLLRLAADGRIVLAFRPPGFTAAQKAEGIQPEEVVPLENLDDEDDDSNEPTDADGAAAQTRASEASSSQVSPTASVGPPQSRPAVAAGAKVRSAPLAMQNAYSLLQGGGEDEDDDDDDEVDESDEEDGSEDSDE